MPNSREKLYTSLSEGQLIGPDHHKFQLKGSASDCPLGQLWNADDVSTKTAVNVSLIFLDPVFLLNKSFLANFKKQIVRAKSIKQAHVTDIYGYFIHKGGLLFFAFESVDSLNLEQLLTSSANKSLSIKQTQGLLNQLAGAITSCTNKWHHALGGIESQFVFVNKKGGVKFLPLSMREFFHDLPNMPKTVYFYKSLCSPQALSNQKINLDSDSYALAVVTNILLGGEELSPTDTPKQRSETQFSKPKDISDDQWSALKKALEPEVKDRFPNSSEFIKSFIVSQAPSEAIDSKPKETQDNETAQPIASSSAKKKKRAFNVTIPLGKKRLAFKLPYYAIALCVFVVGIALGFVLGVFSSAEKIDDANHQAQKWKNQAIQQELENDDNIEQLRLTIDKLNDTTSENQNLQKKVNENDNAPALSIFRDPLSQDHYGPDMVIIDAGSFSMGSSANDANDNEKPAHQVTIKQKFAIARYETTFAQYDFFAKSTNRPLPADNNWGRDNQPVINISWNDATAYTQWLAKETQLDYRLPTEAEWEYSARAGTKANYWWGDISKPGYAHCSDCGHELSGKQPLPVGTMKANPWGLYDLNGNVDEWVSDCYLPNHLSASKIGKPYQPSNCQNRTMRGGSWFDIKRITRSASRYRHPPTATRNSWGFRVALTINQE
jgi:formylglycine-generating enzyme required for sulfatase activity